jgi:hypothetical protein
MHAVVQQVTDSAGTTRDTLSLPAVHCTSDGTEQRMNVKQLSTTNLVLECHQDKIA